MTWIKTLFWKLVNPQEPESPQMVVVLSASAALILTLAAVVVSCAYHILKTGDLGTGAVTALISSIGGLTALAIHSNRVPNA